MPQTLHTAEQAVDATIAAVGKKIVLGVPLGIGKPNHYLNALYQRAKQDQSIHLTILTALSLEAPSPQKGLAGRLLNPVLEGIFEGYQELDYMADLRQGKIPDNIVLEEFFLKSGGLIGNRYAQQHYCNANYTHVPRDLIAAGVNVVAQKIVKGEHGKLSLSCNPEITLDLSDYIAKQKAAGNAIFTLGQVHNKLPYMLNDAEVSEDNFDAILDNDDYSSTLFAPPDLPISDTDHAIGLYASTLVKDGGTLQIGIGSLSDALVYACKLRHEAQTHYQQALEAMAIPQHFAEVVNSVGGELGAFEKGLYGCSEMLVDGFIDLLDAGVIKRPVYPNIETQHKANAGKLSDEEKAELEGTLIHGGFFLGPEPFYQKLRDLPPEQRRAINMTSINFINGLYDSPQGSEQLKRAQRQHARFINTVFKMSLLGSATSDGLENGQVVSGVGGQYNFVAQAHELDDARSILLLKSTHTKNGNTVSNIVWNYGHVTIPRHLRDIVITEYGIADLRGKTDAEVIKSLLNIADSRFQRELVNQAIEAGKLDADYTIPEAHRGNTPEKIASFHKAQLAKGLFPAFPFACAFSNTEQRLISALAWLSDRMHSKLKLAKAAFGGLSVEQKAYEAELGRMGLDTPQSLEDRLYKALLLSALNATEINP
mgnify:CR=1 FL=1